jgi:hypothetical protein
MTTKAITKHIVNDDQTRKQIFRVLLSALSVLCLCYVYFIGSITFNILERRTLETTMRDTASRVSGLEVEYLTLTNSIDIPRGLARGFVEARKNTIFATRTTGGTVAIR